MEELIYIYSLVTAFLFVADKSLVSPKLHRFSTVASFRLTISGLYIYVCHWPTKESFVCGVRQALRFIFT